MHDRSDRTRSATNNLDFVDARLASETTGRNRPIFAGIFFPGRGRGDGIPKNRKQPSRKSVENPPQAAGSGSEAKNRKQPPPNSANPTRERKNRKQPPAEILEIGAVCHRGDGLSPCRSRYREGAAHEVHLVQSDAVAASAGRFPGEAPFRLGGYRLAPVRPGEEQRGLQHLSRPLGICRHARLRRHRLQRASPERLRADASPNLIAAALARRTKDVALVVLGNSIALYNPPVRVAEEFAMLDCISGGRLVAGFPVGTSMDTNYCYGQIPALTREKYMEAHDLIRRAWRDPDPFAWNGRYTKLRRVNLWPRPIQQPHPPIHIPGGGSVETYDFCIDNTYSYSYLSFTGYIRAKALMDGYWKRVAERGAPDDSPY